MDKKAKDKAALEQVGAARRRLSRACKFIDDGLVWKNVATAISLCEQIEKEIGKNLR